MSKAPARLATYLRVLAFGSGARVFALASQLVVLLILSRVLPKSDFGDAMMVFAIYRIWSAGFGTGIGSLLLYHCSRRPDDLYLSTRLHRSAALVGFVLAALLTISCAASAAPLAQFIGKPGLESWLLHMAPLGVGATLMGVLTSALESKSRITQAIVYGEVVPNALRLVLLPLVPLFGLPQLTVAYILSASVLLPWIWGARDLFTARDRGLERWTRWDIGYVARFVFYSLASNQLMGVDMVVVGVFFTSEAAADYAIAARIATLYPFFQVIIARQFTPRAGLLIAQRDLAALQRETDVCRRFSVMAVGMTIAAVLAAGPFLLPLFGDYGGALPLLLILGTASFTRAFFAGGPPILQIGGASNWSLAIMLASFLIVVAAPYILAPLFGIAALPLSMLLSAVLLNPITGRIVQRRFSVRLIRATEYGLIALAILISVAVALRGAPTAEILMFSAMLTVLSGVFLTQRSAGSTKEARPG